MSRVPAEAAPVEKAGSSAPAPDWRAIVSDAVIALDEQGRIAAFTPGAQERLGPLADDRGLPLVDRLRASDRVVFLHALGRVRAGEAREEIGVTMRLDEAGREWVDLLLALVRHGDELLALAKTDESRAEAAPVETPLQQPAVGTDAADDVADLAHELRTPLNAVVGYAQALEAGLFGTLAPRQADAVARIVDASEHLIEVSNAVLDGARLRDRQAAIECRAAPVAPAVERSLDLLKGTAEERGITFANRVTTRSGDAFHDGAALRQIMINLLSNGLKACERGGIVSVDAKGAADTLEITVRDTGCGMSAGQVERLGARFARGAACEGESTGGLGLMLAARLVARQGGSLGLESRLGEGTVVTVTLPRREVAEAPAVPVAHEADRPAVKAVDVPVGAKVLALNTNEPAVTARDTMGTGATAKRRLAG